jgi:hypothetical protein
MGALSNPAFWLLMAIFAGSLGFAVVRCRDVVAPRHRVAYMILWSLAFGCGCIAAYYHTGATAIVLFIFAIILYAPLNFLERDRRGGPK